MGVGIDRQVYEYVGQQRGEMKRDWKTVFLTYFVCLLGGGRHVAVLEYSMYVGGRYASVLEPPKSSCSLPARISMKKHLKLRRVVLCACLKAAV